MGISYGFVCEIIIKGIVKTLFTFEVSLAVLSNIKQPVEKHEDNGDKSGDYNHAEAGDIDWSVCRPEYKGAYKISCDRVLAGNYLKSSIPSRKAYRGSIR